MEFTRNHYLIVGVLLFLAGLQFRYVSSFVLNEKTTQFVNKRIAAAPAMEPRPLFSFNSPSPLASRRVVKPPKWLGFSLMSIGGVLFFFSLTMKRSG